MQDDRRAVLSALGLSLGPAVGLGLGRFAYSLIVPAMQADLGWSFALAGWVNAANAAGYLTGAMLAPVLAGRFGAGPVFRLGLILLPLCLAAMAVPAPAAALALVRFGAGLAAGLIFVSGGTLVIALTSGHEKSRGLALSTFYAGAGLGMAVSALIVPPLLHVWGASFWPVAWVALAVLSVAGGLAAARGGRVDAQSAIGPSRGSIRGMGRILIGYALFGLGSIGYLTFVFGWLAAKAGGTLLASVFWVTLGLAAMVAPLIWQGVIAKARGGKGFGILVATNALGAGVPFVVGGLPGILVSAALFGATFFTIVAATSAFVGRLPPSLDRASAVRAFTVAFGLGQLIGPVAVGFATDLTGSLTAPLVIAVAFILAGAILGQSQRDIAE